MATPMLLLTESIAALLGACGEEMCHTFTFSNNASNVSIHFCIVHYCSTSSLVMHSSAFLSGMEMAQYRILRAH